MRCIICGSLTQDGLVHEGKVLCRTCLERLSEDLPLKKIHALMEYVAYLEDARLLLKSASHFDFATDDLQKAIDIIERLLDRMTVLRLVKA